MGGGEDSVSCLKGAGYLAFASYDYLEKCQKNYSRSGCPAPGAPHLLRDDSRAHSARKLSIHMLEGWLI